MHSDDLTTEQAARIEHRRARAGYLGRLCRRMEMTGFAPDDKLYRLTTEAYE